MPRNARLAIALLILSFGATVVAAQSYTVTDLGSLGGTPTAYAINDSGEVVGASRTVDSTVTHAFYWTAATGMVDIGTMGGNLSQAFGLNSHGVIVGTSILTANANGVAFVWTAESGFHDLGSNGDAYSISDRGQIAAIAGNNQVAFVVSKAAGRVPLGTLGGSNTVPHAMNEQGRVVGYSFTAGNSVYHAFLWKRATGMKDLGTLGGINSYGLGVNQRDQVVGWATIPGTSFAYHAFHWTQSGGMKDLGTFGGTYSLALGINESGQVVGSANIAGDTDAHAFLWTAKGGMIDLNSTIPAGSGWDLNSASAINANGQIVGDGLYNGQIHAFLLTPASLLAIL